MTDPRRNDAQFSKTCLAYIFKWLKSQPEFYGRRSRSMPNKYFTKGLGREDDAIKFAGRVLKWNGAKKNTERKHDDWIQGEADVILEHSVEDIKNSWDEETFPLFATEAPDEGYWWQLQGYCHLYEKDQAGIVYTLMDAPEELIEREARRLAWDAGTTDVTEELYQAVKKSMTFEHYPDDLRLKRFGVTRDTMAAGRVYSRVMDIRRYIAELPDISTFITLHSDEIID